VSLLFVAVFAVFVGVAVIAVLQWQAKQRRREFLHQWALQHAFEYAADDNGLPRQYPFALFDRGEGRGCDNVIKGTWDGVPVVAADYWYYTTSTDSEGNTSRDYDHFSVVVASLDAWLPRVRVEHENLFTRLADHVGLRDIDFESEEFNRRFNVKCDDRAFAFKLLDARMIHWLLGPGAEFCVEVNGDHALLWRGQIPPERVPELLSAVKGFVGEVPRLVWNEYGKAAS
jgi:hypothetical protein